jgi:four helix bundle protein
MKYKHEDLEIWQSGMDLIDEIYDIADRYPNTERYNLRSQLISSATSIPMNIAEGSGRSTDRDNARFVAIAIGSLLETDTNLKIAIRRKYIVQEDYDSVDEALKILYYKMIKFEKFLRSRNRKR